MWIESVRTTGLRSAPEDGLTGLARRVEVSGGAPGVAVADALSMLAGTLDNGAFEEALRVLELTTEDTDLVVDGLPDEASGLDASGVRPLLRDRPGDAQSADGRRITIDVTISLDPGLYGMLREAALRDPRVATGLMDAATIALRVGWLFNPELEAVTVAPIAMAVADQAFPVVGGEKPAWMDPVLGAVGRRLGRMDPRRPVSLVAERLLDASLSAEPESRVAFGRASASLAAAPWSLGPVELTLARGSAKACFGAALLRARQLGPRADLALRLVEAVYLDAPDVLVVSGITDPEVVAWLVAHTQGDDATLEQVILT